MSSLNPTNEKIIHRQSGDIVIKEFTNSSMEDGQVFGYDFIKKLFLEFAKESIRFGENRYGFIMYPHHYRERQLSSILLPILHKLCNGFVMAELPVKRKGTNTVGWVDYWCIYKGYTLVIEVKHSRDLLETTTIRQNSIIKRWEEMIDQLKTVVGEIKTFEEKTKGVIRIGLHFISSLSNNDNIDDERIQKYRDNIDETLTNFCKVLKPDYSGAWIVPQKSDRNWAGYAFPGVLLMGKVYSPIKHR